MNREDQAIKFVNALRAYQDATKPIVEFDRMLVQWGNQRNFTWAGIKLEMTDEVAQVFRRQLALNLENLRTELNIVRELLNADG